ncbi:MAG: transposase [Patescibacteria group bacterium]
MTRQFQFEKGEYYHIYNRGFEKSPIFRDKPDRARFMRLLFLCNSKKPVIVRALSKKLIFGNSDFEKLRGDPIVDLGAYCLMGNHFHLLVREVTHRGISAFMQKLTTAYTMYFNTRYERAGGLLQGTFKARHLDSDEYLKYAFSYIHLNPVEHIDPEWKDNGITDRKKVDAYLNSYNYFSLPDYLGDERPEHIIVDRNVLPRYFQTRKDLLSEMNDWLMYQQYTKV